MNFNKETRKSNLISRLSKNGFTIRQGLDEYENQHSVLLVECDYGHNREVRVKTLLETPYCPTCLQRELKTEFKNLVESQGYKLLEEFQNAETKVLVECPKGHRYKVRPRCFRSGDRCQQCYYKTKVKTDFYDLAAKRGFIVKGVYKNNTTPVELECKNGHHCVMTPRQIRRGFNCPECRHYGFDRNKPTYFYLVKWKKKKYEFLKFGITNRTYQRRINQQSRKTLFKPSLLECRWCISGEQCLELEQRLHKKYVTGVIDRNYFEDGWTETIHYSPEVEQEVREMIKGLR